MEEKEHINYGEPVVLLVDILRKNGLQEKSSKAVLQSVQHGNGVVGCKRRLRCLLCNVECRSKREMSTHVVNEHGTSCHLCGKFYSPQKGYRLFKHWKRHESSSGLKINRDSDVGWPGNSSNTIVSTTEPNIGLVVSINESDALEFTDDANAVPSVNEPHDFVLTNVADAIDSAKEPDAVLSMCTLPLPADWSDDPPEHHSIADSRSKPSKNGAGLPNKVGAQSLKLISNTNENVLSLPNPLPLFEDSPVRISKAKDEVENEFNTKKSSSANAANHLISPLNHGNSSLENATSSNQIASLLTPECDQVETSNKADVMAVEIQRPKPQMTSVIEGQDNGKLETSVEKNVMLRNQIKINRRRYKSAEVQGRATSTRDTRRGSCVTPPIAAPKRLVQSVAPQRKEYSEENSDWRSNTFGKQKLTKPLENISKPKSSIKVSGYSSNIPPHMLDLHAPMYTNQQNNVQCYSQLAVNHGNDIYKTYNSNCATTVQPMNSKSSTYDVDKSYRNNYNMYNSAGLNHQSHTPISQCPAPANGVGRGISAATNGAVGRLPLISNVTADTLVCSLCNIILSNSKFSLRAHFLSNHKGFLQDKLAQRVRNRTPVRILPDLSCAQCSYQTTDPTMLSEHIIQKHQTGLHYCHSCDYTSLFETELAHHKALHHATRNCKYCQFTTPSDVVLSGHIAKYHCFPINHTM